MLIIWLARILFLFCHHRRRRRCPADAAVAVYFTGSDDYVAPGMGMGTSNVQYVWTRQGITEGSGGGGGQCGETEETSATSDTPAALAILCLD